MSILFRFLPYLFILPTHTLLLLRRNRREKEIANARARPLPHKDDFAELQAANKALFENFLLALQAVAGDKNLQSVTLQTGGKYYMVHASPASTPCREDDPRRATPGENFYYPQEDFLAAQQVGKRWSWNVIRPTGIIGCTGKFRSTNIYIYPQPYILLEEKTHPT